MSLDGVRVAVRVRPQNARERAAGYKVGTTVLRSQKSIQISDKTFTYDHVFDIPSTQEELFNEAVEDLVNVTMSGFNATILAYGQTGSGKTHTMGTAFEASMLSEDKIGVIPRAAIQIFNQIDLMKSKAAEAGEPEPQVSVEAQFVEIYNEEVADLLAPNGRNPNVRIVENPNGDIQLHNATFLSARNLEEAMEILKRGSLNRTTGATNMNEQSSRSHAIFSLHLRQEKMVAVGDESDDNVLTALTAKLHFVDLAGSERMQRTGATGQRAKEGCKINEGLLMLGNVINALTDPKVSFIPYRSSKLTRVLRDSLGGNSKTLMIACISPNDIDFAETFSTLNYAARANTIKNKVKVNRDHGGAIVAQLRAQIAELETELNEFRQGKRVLNPDGDVAVSDQFHENAMLMTELNKLRPQNAALKQTADVLTERVAQLKSELERQRINNVLVEAGADSDTLQSTIDDIVNHYVEESARLEARIQELTAENEEYKRRNQRLQRAPESPYLSASPYNQSNALLEEARRQLDDEKKRLEIRKEQRAATAPSTARMESSISSDVSMEKNTTGNSTERSSPDADEDEDVDVEMAELTTESDAEADQTLAEAEISRALVFDDVTEVEDEINIKQRLIEELERKEREFVRMRSDYDRKLQELYQRMMETEKERDEMVLSASQKKSSTDKESEQRVKTVRADYERRLNQMKTEYNGMRRVQSQYDAIRKKEENYRRDLEKAKRELQIAKENRVRLMTQMREEGKKVKRAELDVQRRMAKLEKEARAKDNKIRTLETRDRQREEFMRRKIETSNRANQVPRSAARYGAPARKLPGRTTRATPTAIREKWNILEKKINSCVSEYRNMSKLNNQLVRLINQRTEVERTLNELEKKFVAAKVPEERDEINAELESTTAHLKYVKSEVAEMERHISEIESSNKENDGDQGGNVQASLMNLISKCDSLSECRILLQNLVNWALMKASEVDTEKAKSAELKEIVEEYQQQNSVQQLQMTELIKSVNRNRRTGDTDQRPSASEVTFIVDKDTEQTIVLDPSATPKRSTADLAPLSGLRAISEKHRRRTATPADLLMPPEKLDTGFAVIDEEEQTSSTGRTDADSPLDEVSKRETADTEAHLVHTLMFERRPVGLSAEVGRLAVVDRNRTCSVYDLEMQKLILTQKLERKPRDVHLFHNDPNLLGIFHFFNIHIWDIRVGSAREVRCLHSSGVVDTCYSTERTVHGSESDILPFAVSPNGRYMVTRHIGGVRIWDLNSFQSIGRICELNAENSSITSLAVNNSGDSVCAGMQDGDIMMVELGRNGRETATDFIPRHDSAVNGMLNTGASLYTISDTKLMRHSLIDKNRDLSESFSHSAPLSVITPFRPVNVSDDDDNDLFVTGEGTTIKLWSAGRQSQRATTRLELPDAARNRIVALTSSNGLIASCGSETTVKIWNPSK